MRRVDHDVASRCMCNTEQRRRGSSDGLIISYRFRPLLDGFDARRDDFAVLCIEAAHEGVGLRGIPIGVWPDAVSATVKGVLRAVPYQWPLAALCILP